MTKFVKLLSVAAACAFVTAPALAAEAKKEVVEVVGFKETYREVVPVKEGTFVRMDTNNDGVVNFKEFQAVAQLENEYESFMTADKDGNDLLTYQEYQLFDPTKGQEVASKTYVD